MSVIGKVVPVGHGGWWARDHGQDRPHDLRLLRADGPLKFSRQEFELFINDRALAPKTPETYAACKPELEAFLKNVLGHTDFTLQHDTDPRRRFGATVKLAKLFDLVMLLEAANAKA